MLGNEIMQAINSAAAVTPISLLAYSLLATPKQKVGANELRQQLQLSIDLLRRFRYSDLITLPDMTPDEIIAHGEKLDVISRSSHPMGEVIHMSEHTAVLMTYFRNNILHLLAVPASVACCFIQGRQLEHAELQRLIRLIYPFMRKELFLNRGLLPSNSTVEALGRDQNGAEQAVLFTKRLQRVAKLAWPPQIKETVKRHDFHDSVACSSTVNDRIEWRISSPSTRRASAPMLSMLSSKSSFPSALRCSTPWCCNIRI